MSKSYFKRLLVMIVSGLVIGLGVHLAVSANVGTDPMTTFQVGLSKTFKLELALCSFSANVLFTILSFLIDKKAAKLTDVIYPFIISLGIKLSSFLALPTHSIVLRYVYLLLALVVVGLGIALGVYSKVGNSPYDGFAVLLSEKTNKQFKQVRLVLDVILLVAGIALRGDIGLGTGISILLQGTITQFFIENLEKCQFLNKFTAD